MSEALDFWKVVRELHDLGLLGGEYCHAATGYVWFHESKLYCAYAHHVSEVQGGIPLAWPQVDAIMRSHPDFAGMDKRRGWGQGYSFKIGKELLALAFMTLAFCLVMELAGGEDIAKSFQDFAVASVVKYPGQPKDVAWDDLLKKGGRP
jgi:hypothetical protein